MLIHACKYLNSLLYVIPTFSNKHTCWVRCRHLLLTRRMCYQHILSSGVQVPLYTPALQEMWPPYLWVYFCNLVMPMAVSQNSLGSHLHTRGVCPCVVHSVIRFWAGTLETLLGLHLHMLLFTKTQGACSVCTFLSLIHH